MALNKIKKRPKRLSFNSKSTMAYSSSSNSFRFNYRRIYILIPIVFISFAIAPFFISQMRSSQAIEIHSIEVVNEFPHDPDAFTQGLLYAGNDVLYESTGLNGRSSVRKVALQTGKVEAIHNMDYSYFGEGLTLLGKRLFQVTWLKKEGFIYDYHNLSKVESYTHQMQDGWGLATDGQVLFGTDGTSTLYKMDPKSFKLIEKHTVRYHGHEVRYLNELEYINGEVWANVWQTDCIARISHKDGAVIGWILLPNLREELLKAGARNIDVLNGIAWDSDNDRLFVTGKLWPKLYEIKLHPVKKQLKSGYIEQYCIP